MSDPDPPDTPQLQETVPGSVGCGPGTAPVPSSRGVRATRAQGSSDSRALSVHLPFPPTMRLGVFFLGVGEGLRPRLTALFTAHRVDADGQEAGQRPAHR